MNYKAASFSPYKCNLLNNIEWSKVSNAFEKSENILMGVSLESMAVIVLSITSIMAYSVE